MNENYGSPLPPAAFSPLKLPNATTTARRCKSEGCLGFCEMVEIEPAVTELRNAQGTVIQPAKDAVMASFSLYCEMCVERIQAEEAAGEAKKDHQFLMAQRRAWWEKTWKKGSSYHETKIDMLPDRDATLKVMKWTHKHPKGVLLQGASGSGKTRTVFLLLREILFQHGVYPTIRKCVKLRTEIADASRNEGDRKSLLAKLINAQILYLDDLGQMAATASSEEALLEIIEERSHLGRPVIATTQYSGEAFVQPFTSRERGLAIARRLADTCYVINFAAKRQLAIENEIPAL